MEDEMKNGQPRILQHNLFVPETHTTAIGSVSLFCAPNKRFCTTHIAPQSLLLALLAIAGAHTHAFMHQCAHFAKKQT
jgi:hypothetical protein